ncbi:oxysterol binding protein [Aspergillus ambiguus]|uniref:oxysterol-binding protein related protein OSH3 n=1 Tax=Aspergillus ambiguus TaxID=176160 RepID=UPI003CCD8096
MAAMEELEIHSKSYFVRWVNVKAGHTISWSIQPHKKSLNFGIFKHPGHSAVLGSSSNLPSDSHSTDSNENLPATANSSSSRLHGTSASVIEKLTGIGLKQIRWVGKCEAEKIVQGTYDVPSTEGGNYALVFDNTFSKQLSKTVTLVLLTYPTDLPPQSAPVPHAGGPMTSHGTDSSDSGKPKPLASRRRGNSVTHALPQPGNIDPASVHTGVLHKRRRKRHQGWARRFFSLDFTSSTLSYYHDRNSSALRGSIPLSLAAVACNEKSREISIDSGTEIWHLRASNEQEFFSWKRALEKASSSKTPGEELHQPEQPLLRVPSLRVSTNPAEEREWEHVQSLVSKVSGSRDAVRRLAKDTDPKYLTYDRPRGRSPSPHPPSDANGVESADPRERRPFWKRKTSGNTPAGGVKRNTTMASSSSQLVVPGSGAGGSDAASLTGERKPSSVSSHPDQAEEIHDHLMALLRDLDNVVSEFTSLIAESKTRRHAAPSLTAQSRMSFESDVSQEFFDAVDGGNSSPLLTIQGDSDDEAAEEKKSDDRVVSDDAPSDSDEDGSEAAGDDRYSSFFPPRPKSLSPLPLDPVRRRSTIAAPTVMPPSLIGFLRKNVGKDLSQISMPVSSNEPLSLLQRGAEVMEYAGLLDKAAHSPDAVERLLYVTAYALSTLSSNRVRERALRKPFNPMLGETYELVREDLGFRFVAEKVSHRPVQLAYQADARDWSLAQSPMPSQKFWGKSAEIVTDGKMRLTLHPTGEHFSWSPATSFLRNIIAGEKYVEPVGEMTVANESSGHKSISVFKAGGMFSGRSEDVSTRALDPAGRDLPLGLVGSWTAALQLSRNGSPTGPTIWQAGALVPNAPKVYGMTAFAAALNEVTAIEDGRLPATDSRLRPDQRALEDGDVDRAEELKVQLEEGQRARRREMEAAGQSWTPRWFVPADEAADANDGEVVWRLKSGKDGYWEERAKGTWSGVVPVFEK